MHVGLLSLGDLITDPVTGARRTHAERHRNLIDQAVLAESVGFDSVHLGEHHFCDYILSSPPVVLAAIAERTTRLRLSTGVALGVNLDPLRLAEDYATVDVLSGGRVEPVIGRGTFFPHTYDAFGQNPKLAKDMFAEHLELLIAVWEGEEVTWSGRHRTPIAGVTVNPRPLQQPRPPIWAGVGASADSIDLAARLGLRLMLPTVFGTIDMFRRAVDFYETRWEHYGQPSSAKRIGCCTHTYVHESSRVARTVWEPRYRAYIEWVDQLQKMSSGGRGTGLDGFDFDQLTANTAMCGSPAEIIDRMGQMRDTLRVDTQILMFDMGGMPDEELFATIELTGKEVIPTVSGFS
jgi:alkanesulfonate monooxygenase SsuD/methylene tetrahydromethanopterin reductase-like flavin-dependent oxidoreductase (luciferase family)